MFHKGWVFYPNEGSLSSMDPRVYARCLSCGKSFEPDSRGIGLCKQCMEIPNLLVG
jgi:hypothetical protein